MAEVRGMYLMSKAPRTVILSFLTVALTDAQVLSHRWRQLLDYNLRPNPKLHGVLIL